PGRFASRADRTGIGGFGPVRELFPGKTGRPDTPRGTRPGDAHLVRVSGAGHCRKRTVAADTNGLQARAMNDGGRGLRTAGERPLRPRPVGAPGRAKEAAAPAPR